MARVIVEADGGSRGNPGPAAYGAVVRDAGTGQVLAERAAHIGRATNNVAEYRGLIAGLEAAREIDPDVTVEARLDSKLVVEQMSGRWQIKHPSMRPLAVRARDVLPAERVTYVWVPRERNKHADRLANEALDAAARGQEWDPGSSTAELHAGAREPVADRPVNALVGWDVGLGTPTTMLLLRHGETPHTVEHRFSGAGGADPSLTTEGERQARAAGEVLAAAGGIDAVLSSPMRRARQTAEVAARNLDLEVTEVDDLRECAFGDWEGQTYPEVRSRWPDELAAWLADPRVAPPGGESLEAVQDRVSRAREAVLGRYAGRSVLVVSHVTPVKLLVTAALGAPLSALHRIELMPASLTEIRWYAAGFASLCRLNDSAHL